MSDVNRTQLLSDPNRTQLGAAPSLDPNRTLMGTAPSLNATQTIKPVQCPVCKSFNPAGVMFCVECGLIFDMALDGDAFGAPSVQLPVLVESGGREHPLRPGETIIGREGDIQILDTRMSRKHAKIMSTDGVLALEDLGSTNGTTHNGSRLASGEAKTLTSGDTLGFGGVEVKLSMPGAANATMMPSINKTAALNVAPKKETAPATLVGNGQEFPLKNGANSFGRKPDNDVQIADAYVSGKHGLIEVTEEGVFVTDIGSTNGTMLNDAKLSPNMRTKLQPEDVIRLGSMEFRVEVQA